MDQLKQVLEQFEGSVSNEQGVLALNLCVHLILAATMGIFIRFLYRRCSTTASDTDSISRVFPLLAIVITAVITVVKSSLALSLGLVGALSIVRFRAAIKDPEELVFLFLCIAVGLALGAEQPLLAVALVGVASLVIVGMHFTGRKQRQHKLLLTITGDSRRHFEDSESGVISVVESVLGPYTLQRFDIENGKGQLRVVLDESNPRQTSAFILQLHDRLPDCDVSYVNLNSTL